MQHAARAVYNATALRAAPVHRTVLGTVQVLRQRPCLVAGTTYARWSATVAMARLHTRTAVRLATTTTATLKTPCPSMSSWPLTYSVSLRQRASAARVEVLARHMSSSASASSSSSSDSESESQLPESHDTNNEPKNQASSTPQQSSSSSSSSDAAASNDAAGSIGGSSSSDSSSSSSSSKPKSIYEPDSDGDEAGQQLTTTNNAPLPLGSSIPAVIPPVYVIPLTVRPLLPGVAAPFTTTNAQLIQALQQRKAKGNPYLGMFFVKNPEAYEQRSKRIGVGELKDLSQLHTVGTLARIESINRLQSGDGTPFASILVTSVARIRLTGEMPTAEDAPVAEAMVELFKIPEFNINSMEVVAHVHEIIATIKELVKLDPLFKEQFVALLDRFDPSNTIELVDASASLTTCQGAEIQEVLASPDMHTRLYKTLELLKQELELAKLRSKIGMQLEQDVSKRQREHLLRQQLKLIKQELGMESDEKETLQTKYAKRLEKLVVPEHAKKIIDEELAKLQLSEPASTEFSITRNYLDWLTVLPWGVHTTDSLEIARAQRVLDEEHYGLKDVKERILEFIAVGNLRNTLEGKILCLVGPPGVGKTSIGRSIANALGRKFYRFSVGGMYDVAELKGHRRTYAGAMPGKLLQCLKLTQSANPVILIDEIDKIGRLGHHGDPASALLEVLDPEQNSSFLDHYLDVPFDLSKVLFVCTANVLESIPGPLLDRMEVIRISGYVLDEKIEIAQKHLLPQARKSTGVKTKQCTIRKGAIRTLIQDYCRESGVRALQKKVDQILRKVALRIAKGQNDPVIVTPENLKDFVGKRVYAPDRLHKVNPPGVITGLAWTSLGGATLNIETINTSESSTPSLRTTGSMGDVMKESTQIAYSFAKGYLHRQHKGNRFFETESIHMHIPEGAVPKDGPSAGITMTTALLSLALDRPVPSDLAMTGEISLTGKVLAIGGVKEKVLAARRSGVKRIIFPKANEPDWEELEDYIRRDLEPFFAETYDQVYEIAFPPQTKP